MQLTKGRIMYKIAICDDDKRYRKTIREIVEHENSLPENEIRFYEYESGNELLKHTDILHELVFIDIRMPGLDGNQTALKLRNYNKDGVLIFCSSYFEPTVDSINFGQPFRYIMKDLHDTSLRREIAAIMTEVKRRFLNDYAVTVTSAGTGSVAAATVLTILEMGMERGSFLLSKSKINLEVMKKLLNIGTEIRVSIRDNIGSDEIEGEI